MQPLSLLNALKAALVASVVAALAAAAFHAIATEPVIERAIALEELQPDLAGEAEMPPLVTRDMQRVGLWIGLLLYGLSWALLFGSLFYLGQTWLPGATLARQGLILAAFAFWAVALLPFLKYPANPPGVGETDTIGLRQNLYFGLLAASIVGVGLTLWLHRYLGRVLSGARQWLAALAFLALYSLVMYLALPNNPDPIRIPAGIVTGFRTLSLVGLSLFWAVFGLGFAWMVNRSTQAQTPERRAIPAQSRESRA